MAKILSANCLAASVAPTVNATTLQVTTTADNQDFSIQVGGVEKVISYLAIRPVTTGFIVKYNDTTVTGEETYFEPDVWTEFHNTSIAKITIMALTGAIFDIKMMQLI